MTGLNSFERTMTITGALCELLVGAYAAWCLYRGWWATLALALILGFWVGLALGQLRISAMWREVGEYYRKKYEHQRRLYSDAANWNRYLWAELTAICNPEIKGLIVTDAYFDVPGPRAGDVIPPEGSAGGS